MAPARYAEDLAYVHDVGFGDFARSAAPGLIGLLRKCRARRVTELGCGAGAMTRALLRAGFDVSALDASAAMLRRARRNAPGARFAAGRLPRAALPPCDAVVAVGEVLNYMARAADFDVLFRRVGGIYRRARETHGLILPPIARLARRLRAAGFDVSVRPGYGAFRVPDGHAVLVARRR